MIPWRYELGQPQQVSLTIRWRNCTDSVTGSPAKAALCLAGMAPFQFHG